ncbi:response regulator [Pedobacter sp. PLR]|uniref:response regulator n=1 Tax=Pedobacter sp. PLR TaxID=2994465 RepID=UPI002245C6BE|nr:response regulator [Pedobacter sp. PLR]MCX2453020.1 response regulator [Pedobacter sp. PLR]
MISFLKRKLQDVTISTKLYFTIGIMAFLVIIELFTLWFAVSTLSSVRAFVNGEGLWSKAQKDAVYSLFLYANSHKEADYQAFKQFLKVPLGDNKARIELQKPNPDLDIAREGFLQGRNHPEDVEGMIHLITRFHNIFYLNKAITAWGGAASTMDQLIAIGDQLHTIISADIVDQKKIDEVMERAKDLNGKVTILEDEFSFTLGEGSRWLENIILNLLLTISLTIGTTSILITVSVSRGIEKGIKEIVAGAALVSRGVLNARVTVYSGDEIGMLANSFNKMIDTLEYSLYNIRKLQDAEKTLKKEKEKAETSEKTKQLFLAKMSHEIRTPMNAILGFARLLEETIENKEQQEYIQIIIKSGDDLLVILNDILDFSRMEAGKLIFESIPLNLKEIIQMNILMMEPKWKKKNIEINYLIDEKIPATILGDSVRLNQILINLISNALKFTEKGHVSISVICIEQNEEKIILDFGIKDTGIGIDGGKLGQIFESFEQATNETARKFGGAGLGLSIVKQLVQLQHGEIFVNSKPGLGSDFHFRLPFLKVSSHVKKDIAEKFQMGVQLGAGIHVLVVEDNLINQMLVIKILKQRGFETETAETGLIALSKYEKNHFDIVLMDVQMPEMDGYEATKKIRALKDHKKNIPIIAMTAHTIKGEYERCLEIGMDDYISKPFDKKELFEKIFKLLKKD